MKKDFTHSIKEYIGRHADFVFLFVLVLFFGISVYAVRNSVDLIIAVNAPADVVRQSKDVRVDFSAYDSDVRMVQQAAVYESQISASTSPFKAMVKPGS